MSDERVEAYFPSFSIAGTIRTEVPVSIFAPKHLKSHCILARARIRFGKRYIFREP